MQEQYQKRLLAARETDLQMGFTSVGVHRDELTFQLNEQPARTFGSQGQKKSLALALRLSGGIVCQTLSGIAHSAAG